MSITTEDTRELVAVAVRRIVPDADLSDLAPDADLRQTYELDSLDFLGFVELLSERSGVRIEEEDYPALRSLESITAFLQERAP
jgi:acyl carrier protein